MRQTLILILMLYACGDNDSDKCKRPQGLHTFDARLTEMGPTFNCPTIVTDTVNFDADPCIQDVTFDSSTCVWEGSGECGSNDIYFRVDDYPNAFYLVSVDNVPLCSYDVVIR